MNVNTHHSLTPPPTHSGTHNTSTCSHSFFVIDGVIAIIRRVDGGFVKRAITPLHCVILSTIFIYLCINL